MSRRAQVSRALRHLHRGAGLCVFFNDTATTEIYTLSLHDALPIALVTSALISSSGLNFCAFTSVKRSCHRMNVAFGRWPAFHSFVVRTSRIRVFVAAGFKRAFTQAASTMKSRAGRTVGGPVPGGGASVAVGRFSRDHVGIPPSSHDTSSPWPMTAIAVLTHPVAIGEP